MKFIDQLGKAFGLSILSIPVLGWVITAAGQVWVSILNGRITCGSVDSLGPCGIVEFLFFPMFIGPLFAILWTITTLGVPILVLTLIFLVVLRLRAKKNAPVPPARP